MASSLLYVLDDHIHNREIWLAKSAAPSETDACDLLANKTSAVDAFQVDAGNSAFGSWVCVIGSGDTPVVGGELTFDIHRIHFTAAERSYPYLIQIGTGASGAQVVITEVPFTPSATIDKGPVEIICPRIAAGTKVWVRALCPGQNTGTIDFLLGIHEYGVSTAYDLVMGTDGRPEVNMRQIEGDDLDTNLATLNLKALNITNPDGVAATIQSSDDTAAALLINGPTAIQIDGIAAGQPAVSISTNDTGADAISIDSLGIGIKINSVSQSVLAQSSAEEAVELAAGGNNSGMKVTGAGTGHGIEANSGSGATGNGIHAEAKSTNGNGANTKGSGNRHGFLMEGGPSSGHGLSAIATTIGSSNGTGIYGQGKGTGAGMALLGGHSGGTGAGLDAYGSGGGPGIRGTSSGTDGDGMTLVKSGTGKDINADEIDGIKTKTDQLTFTTANQVDANMKGVSDDTTAADNLETMLDGTGGKTLSLGKLAVNSASDVAVSIKTQADKSAVEIDNASATTKETIKINNGAGANAPVVKVQQAGNGAGLELDGGSNGAGLYPHGVYGVLAAGSSGSGVSAVSNGSSPAIYGLSVDGEGAKFESINSDGFKVVGAVASKDISAKEIDGIKERTDNLPDDPASVTNQTTIINSLITIDGVVDSIKVDTTTALNSLVTIDGVVDAIKVDTTQILASVDAFANNTMHKTTLRDNLRRLMNIIYRLDRDNIVE